MVADNASDPNPQHTPGPISSNGHTQGPMPPLPKPCCSARGARRVYVFVPHDDITTKELTAATEIVMFGFAAMLNAAPVEFVDRLYDTLDEQGRRHWQVKELGQVVVPKGTAGKPGLHLPPGSRG